MSASIDWYDLIEQEERAAVGAMSYAAAVSSSAAGEKTSETIASSGYETEDNPVSDGARVQISRYSFGGPRVCDIELHEISGTGELRLIQDILRNDRNPNVVFVGLLTDENREILAMYVRNCHAQRNYLFDPYGDQRRRDDETTRTGVYGCVAKLSSERKRSFPVNAVAESPGRAMADFVLNNAFGKRELVLVGADGRLLERDVLDAICGRKECRTDREADECQEITYYCTYCTEPAEMVTTSRDGNVYACMYHVSVLPSAGWYCYSPMIVDVSAERRTGHGVRLRLTNKRSTSKTERFVGSLHYRGTVADGRHDVKLTTVQRVHETICPREHFCTSDHIGPFARIDVAAGLERLICLLQKATENRDQ